MAPPAVRPSQAELEQRYKDAVAAVRRGAYDDALAKFDQIRVADVADDDRFVRSPLGRRAALNVAILSIATSGVELQDPSKTRAPQARMGNSQAAREKLDRAEAALRAATSGPTGDEVAALPSAYLTGANLALHRSSLDTLSPFDVRRIARMTLGMEGGNLKVTSNAFDELAGARTMLDRAVAAQASAQPEDRIDDLDAQVAAFRNGIEQQRMTLSTALAIGAMTALSPATNGSAPRIMNAGVANAMGDVTQYSRAVARATARAPGEVRNQMKNPGAWANMWVAYARGQLDAANTNDPKLRAYRDALSAALTDVRNTVR